MTVAAASPATRMRRLRVGVVAAGLAAFALLYATQAVLPDVGATFGVGATITSLTVSVTTGVLALTVLPMSALAERVGRTRVMTAGLAVACLSVVGSALAPVFWALLVFRGLDGLALAAVVAVAMGHIGAETDERSTAAAIGVYVSGTTIGGLIGRLVPAGVTDVAGWRWALIALAGVGAVCTVVFARVTPPARSPAAADAASTARPARGAAEIAEPPGRDAAGIREHLRDPGIVRLCGVGLLLMGGFVATYNYLTYRLGGPPFALSTSVVGLVFLAYLAGTVSSTAAARTVARFGRRRVLLASIGVAAAGLLLTLPGEIAAVLVGLVVFTTGFFGAHSVASGWVTARAVTAKSQASALYLMAYYLGSSLGGSVIGLAWTGGGWPATVAAVGGCLVAAATVAAGVGEPLTGGVREPVATARAAARPADRNPGSARRRTARPRARR